MQKVILIGHLGKDASIKETQKGKRFLSFTMATNMKYAGVEETTWWDVMAFTFNDGIAQYLKKGSMVQVIGDIRLSTSTDSKGVTYVNKSVVVDSLAFADSGSKQQSGETTQQAESAHEVKEAPVQKTETVKPEKFSAAASDDSDLPF